MEVFEEGDSGDKWLWDGGGIVRLDGDREIGACHDDRPLWEAVAGATSSKMARGRYPPKTTNEGLGSLPHQQRSGLMKYSLTITE